MSLPCWLSQFSRDSQQGRDRKTSILVLAFWNFKLRVLKYQWNFWSYVSVISKFGENPNVSTYLLLPQWRMRESISANVTTICKYRTMLRKHRAVCTLGICIEKFPKLFSFLYATLGSRHVYIKHTRVAWSIYIHSPQGEITNYLLLTHFKKVTKGTKHLFILVQFLFNEQYICFSTSVNFTYALK